MLRRAARHPGQLAACMLAKMRAVLEHEPLPSTTKEAKPAAVRFVNTLTFPAHSLGPRAQREMQTLAKIVDLLAENRPGSAADVAAQRLKAVDKAVRDGNNWDRAQYLELVPFSDTVIADRSEEFMAAN